MIQILVIMNSFQWIPSKKVGRTKNRRKMILTKCEVCVSKKSRFIKQQEASGLLSSLGIKKPLSETPLVGPFLF